MTAYPDATSLVTADMDGDGFRDVVTLDAAPYSYGFAPGLPAGGYGPVALDAAVVLNTARGAQVADLDGDGNLDVVACERYTTPGVAVLRGVGDGSISSVARSLVPSQPLEPRLGDLDLDGELDVVVSNAFATDVHVLLGGGGGFFGPPSPVPVAAAQTDLALADLDLDGVPDLVVTASSLNSIEVVLGNGDGTFAATTSYLGGGDAGALLVDDVDGDGNLDVVAASQSNKRLSVLLGNGDGTLQPALHRGAGLRPEQVLATDADGDGNLDLLALDPDTDQLSLVLGSGAAAFGPPVLYTTTHSVSVAALEDANLDGITDVLLAGSDWFGVIRGDGEGGLRSSVQYPALKDSRTLAIADLDFDGYDDVVSSNADATTTVYFGSPNGLVAGPSNSGGYLNARLIDVNGDALHDLVYGLPSGVHAHLGNGDGSFGSKIFSPGPEYAEAASGLVDGDSHLDLVGYGADELTVWTGNGDGTFDVHSTYPTSAQTRGVALHDVSGDGITDVIYLAVIAPGAFVALGAGDGSFGPAVGLGPGGTGVELADVDDDGDLDIVVLEAPAANEAVHVYLAQGGGAFSAQISSPVHAAASYESRMFLADVDEDRLVDLVLNVEIGMFVGEQDLLVYRGQGDGSFAPLTFVPGGRIQFFSQPAVGDIDGDGLADIVSAPDQSGVLIVHRNLVGGP